MNRRSFLPLLAGAIAGPAQTQSLPFQAEKSKLIITGLRVVKTRPRKQPPAYKLSPGAWSGEHEIANPMSIYPEFKAKRSLFMPDDPAMAVFTVEVSTDKGVKGYGTGGAGGATIAEKHLSKLIAGKDPFDLERNWDIMWRSTMYYGRMGAAVHAISAVDLALWDIVGRALGEPVYKLLGGAVRERIPAYCTGNNFEHHIAHGFKRLKLAIPYGPADGKEGMKKNAELVKRTREVLGPDGDVMLDCWMAWNERYTLEMAEMLEPHRVYWMEECLQPHDYEGFGRLNATLRSTRIATGEHEYTRYGFRLLLQNRSASIWQPDIQWCGGLTELRRIGALAAANDIPMILHGGGRREGVHYILATPGAQWAEMSMPYPGGPKEVYERWEVASHVSRGPEGVYTRPPQDPGFGQDFEVTS